MCRLFFLKTRVTAEHVRGVVGVHSVFYRVIEHYQTWAIPHMKVTKQWDRTCIHVSSPLDYYTTGEVNYSSSRVQKPGRKQKSMPGL